MRTKAAVPHHALSSTIGPAHRRATSRRVGQVAVPSPHIRRQPLLFVDGCLSPFAEPASARKSFVTRFRCDSGRSGIPSREAKPYNYLTSKILDLATICNAIHPKSGNPFHFYEPHQQRQVLRRCCETAGKPSRPGRLRTASSRPTAMMKA